MRSYSLIARRNDQLIVAGQDPFRRSDVLYTTVAWRNPVTGDQQQWSVPIEFLVTFFEPASDTPPEEVQSFEQEREEWLQNVVVED